MKTVIVLGDLNLDVILAGMEDYPCLGKEILAQTHLVEAGGSAANVASMLAADGCPVRLFSRVGNDSAGDYVVKSLEQRGVDTATIVRSNDQPTGITVSLTYSHDRMYISHLGTVTSTALDDLPDGYLCPGAHLHLSSYFLQQKLQPSVGRLLQEAKEAGMSTSLDPGGDPSGQYDMSGLNEYFQYLDWFMPNADEIRAIANTKNVEEAIRAFSPEVVGLVVKMAARGAMTRYRGNVEHTEGHAVPVVDTTCAGDCFDAGFLHGLSRGGSTADAVRLGNEYGAKTVSRVGLPL